MTPNSHDITPPPLVTHIHPLSHRYLQAARAWKATHAARSVLLRTLRVCAVLLVIVVPRLLKTPFKHLLQGLLGIGRFITRTTNAILTVIYETIVTIIRRLIPPTLVLGTLVLLLISLNPDNRQSLKNATPTLATLAPEAGAKPLPPDVAKPLPPPQRPSRLTRFHEPAQQFPNELARIEGLADTLNIPPHVVGSDINRALDLADTNARAMHGHVGRFPLPTHTSNRLLAALTPSDVDQLAQLLEHATTIDKRSFTLAANLSSGDLFLKTRVTALSNRAATGACFRYAMTFARRTFRHALTFTACRKRDRWTFLAPQTKGH